MDARGRAPSSPWAESTRWAARAGLLATTAERRGGRAEADDPPDPGTPDQPIEYLDAIVPADEAPASVPGAILRVLLDDDHWLASGTDGEIGVLVEGSRVFRPVTLADGTNVGRYADEDDLLLGGIVWEESRAPAGQQGLSHPISPSDPARSWHSPRIPTTVRTRRQPSFCS